MAKSNSTDTPPIRITAEMRQRFQRCAPAALARRSDAYISGIALNVAQWLLIGTFGLVGLYYWDWTSTDLLLVFVAGIVAAIVADSLKYLVARGRMLSDYEKMKDDRLVWVLFQAMRDNKDEVSAERLKDVRPGPSLLLDLALGGVGLWVLASQADAFGLQSGQWSALGLDVRIGLVVVCVAPLLSMIASISSGRRAEGGYDDLEFRAGGRGFSLLLLAGGLAGSGAGSDAARGVMLFLYWATVVVGVISIFGVWIIRAERDRLRTYLAGKGGNAAGGSTP